MSQPETTTDIEGSAFMYKLAALLLQISGVLHFITPLFAGFSDDVMMLLPVGLIYLLLSWGVYRGWRSVGWIAFLVVLPGAVFAFANAYSGTTVPAWIYAAITLADLLAAITLFVILWRSKRVTA